MYPKLTVAEKFLHYSLFIAKKVTEKDTPGVGSYYSTPGVEGKIYNSKKKIPRIKTIIFTTMSKAYSFTLQSTGPPTVTLKQF